jgi:UDP-glucose:(heptosyl)LPS alpha-1,3-glucosyltransferase
MVGSQWKNKGFDRAAHAVASLPPQIRCSTRLVAVGETSIAPYARKAKKLGIADRVSLMPPREDIGRYYLGSDLLVHPAHDENTGGVILESMLHGLPVLTTDVCGYATHVTAAQGGVVIPSPFSQTQMNHAVFDLITSPNRQALGTNAKTYVQSLDLYTRPRRVVDLIEARAERKRRATSPA